MNVLEDGTLAGSILKMNEEARQMLQLKNASIKNIFEMTSENSAGVITYKGEKLDGNSKSEKL